MWWGFIRRPLGGESLLDKPTFLLPLNVLFVCTAFLYHHLLLSHPPVALSVSLLFSCRLSLLFVSLSKWWGKKAPPSCMPAGCDREFMFFRHLREPPHLQPTIRGAGNRKCPENKTFWVCAFSQCTTSVKQLSNISSPTPMSRAYTHSPWQRH